MRSSEAVGALFDYAVEHADGFTYQDVQKDLRWDKPYFTQIHRKLRILLGNDDQINLVCNVQGKHQPWRYSLVGNLEDARGWIANRLRDTESRITTMRSMCSSIVRATDGRTNDGRRARIINKGLTRVMEDLAELDHGTPLF